MKKMKSLKLLLCIMALSAMSITAGACSLFGGTSDSSDPGVSVEAPNESTEGPGENPEGPGETPEDPNGPTDGPNNPGSDIVGVQYTVEHYFEKITAGEYELYNTQTLLGEVGAEVTAQALTIDGFSLDENNTNNNKTGVIANSGLALKLYYQRNSYEVSIGSTEIQLEAQTVKYGETVAFASSSTEKAGYESVVYYSYGDNQKQYLIVGEDGTYSFEMPATNITISVDFIPNLDTKVTTEHYVQNLFDNQFTLYQSTTSEHETDSLANIATISIFGYAYNADIEGSVSSVTVSADGSSVLKAYYEVDPVEIGSTEEFVRYLVEDEDEDASVYYQLTTDLDFEGTNAFIDCKTSSGSVYIPKLSGIFDGNGYSLKNIALASGGNGIEEFKGVFGEVSGVLKNVKFEGIYLYAWNYGGMHVKDSTWDNRTDRNGYIGNGGMVCKTLSGTMENVVINASITGQVHYDVGGTSSAAFINTNNHLKLAYAGIVAYDASGATLNNIMINATYYGYDLFANSLSTGTNQRVGRPVYYVAGTNAPASATNVYVNRLDSVKFCTKSEADNNGRDYKDAAIGTITETPDDNTLAALNNNSDWVWILGEDGAYSFVDKSEIGSYTIEYYILNDSTNEFELSEADTEIGSGLIGSQVEITTPKSIANCVYLSDNTNNIISGTIAADNSLVLKLYYSMERIEIASVADFTTYLSGVEDASGYYVLTADLDFGGTNTFMNYRETGGSVYVPKLSGTFDGNGYSLKNIALASGGNGTEEFKGVFGEVSGVLKNVKFDGIYLYAWNYGGSQVKDSTWDNRTDKNGYIGNGGMVCKTLSGTMENVVINASITGQVHYDVGGTSSAAFISTNNYLKLAYAGIVAYDASGAKLNNIFINATYYGYDLFANSLSTGSNQRVGRPVYYVAGTNAPASATNVYVNRLDSVKFCTKSEADNNGRDYKDAAIGTITQTPDDNTLTNLNANNEEVLWTCTDGAYSFSRKQEEA